MVKDPVRYKEKYLILALNLIEIRIKLIWFHAASIGEVQVYLI